MTDVTEREDVQQEDGQESQKASRKKFVLIGAIGVALLAVAGGGTFFLTQSMGGGRMAHVAEVSDPVFFDLPEITVNLSGDGTDIAFLKLLISLELRDKSMIPVVEPRMPRVLDAFQVYLRELRRQDLDGSAGIYRLKEELQRRVNLAVYPATVDNILFKEVLIQ